ncbi:hypothetical protein [Rhizobium sp. R693]|uniref:hypothetical protein n=1 Tax=Rhizobium sp. R693 TaxID=1764276 RepID=UPI001FD9A47A|nr:hypothetical protein [Rhizobium sp. R693]
MNDLVTGAIVLADIGLGDHPEAEALTVHGDKDAMIRSAQTALDDVIDAKKFWR